MDTLGARVKTLRQSARFTQVQLAERIGINQASLSLIESGHKRRSKTEPIVLSTGLAPQPRKVNAICSAKQCGQVLTNVRFDMTLPASIVAMDHEIARILEAGQGASELFERYRIADEYRDAFVAALAARLCMQTVRRSPEAA